MLLMQTESHRHWFGMAALPSEELVPGSAGPGQELVSLDLRYDALNEVSVRSAMAASTPSRREKKY